MKLCGVTMAGGKLVVDSIETIRETPKTFQVSGNQSWLGYKFTLLKKRDAHRIFFSPEEAIDAYIREQKDTIRRLEHDLKYENLLLVEAEELFHKEIEK